MQSSYRGKVYLQTYLTVPRDGGEVIGARGIYPGEHPKAPKKLSVLHLHIIWDRDSTGEVEGGIRWMHGAGLGCVEDRLGRGGVRIRK